jgi:hypothetical protein
MAMLLMSLLAASSATSVVASTTTTKAMPPNHPSADILAKYSHQFRCPYANDWVTKGPKQAAIDLGLLKSRPNNSNNNNNNVLGKAGLLRARNLQDTAIVAGSCSYTNTWTGQLDCLELRGDVWTEESMETRCASETDSTLTFGTPCTLPPSFGGYCTVVGGDGGVEMSPLAIMGTMDCAQLESTCTTFISGTFEPSEGCGGTSSSSTTSTTAPSNGGVTDETEATASPESNATAYPGAGSIPTEEVICSIAPGTYCVC